MGPFTAVVVASAPKMVGPSQKLGATAKAAAAASATLKGESIALTAAEEKVAAAEEKKQKAIAGLEAIIARVVAGPMKLWNDLMDKIKTSVGDLAAKLLEFAVKMKWVDEETINATAELEKFKDINDEIASSGDVFKAKTDSIKAFASQTEIYNERELKNTEKYNAAKLANDEKYNADMLAAYDQRIQELIAIRQKALAKAGTSESDPMIQSLNQGIQDLMKEREKYNKVAAAGAGEEQAAVDLLLKAKNDLAVKENIINQEKALGRGRYLLIVALHSGRFLESFQLQSFGARLFVFLVEFLKGFI